MADAEFFATGVPECRCDKMCGEKMLDRWCFAYLLMDSETTVPCRAPENRVEAMREGRSEFCWLAL
jgi:hypothetical protein